MKALTALVGPLSWVDEGIVSARLTSQWTEAESNIPVHCEFAFQKVAAHVPQDAAPQTRLVATPVLNWINKHATEFDLAFDVRVPREAMAGQIWLANSALIAEISHAMKDELLSAASNLASAKDNFQDALKQKAIEAAKNAAKKAGKSLLERFGSE